MHAGASGVATPERGHDPIEEMTVTASGIEPSAIPHLPHSLSPIGNLGPSLTHQQVVELCRHAHPSVQ